MNAQLTWEQKLAAAEIEKLKCRRDFLEAECIRLANMNRELSIRDMQRPDAMLLVFVGAVIGSLGVGWIISNMP